MQLPMSNETEMETKESIVTTYDQVEKQLWPWGYDGEEKEGILKKVFNDEKGRVELGRGKCIVCHNCYQRSTFLWVLFLNF